MTTLVIVESPAKAKTISKFLGPEYDVQASFGHVRDLPGKAEEIPDDIKKERWARFGVNLDSNFEPVYIVPQDKQRHVEKLQKSLKKARMLLLATDEDREGESISWHLLELLQPKVPVKRIVFHEITPEAIQEALKKARDVDYNLVHAQESRRIVDRLYGYSLSPVLWKKVQTGLSAGRVQSVAVRLIVEREEERRSFTESEFWDLQAQFVSPMGGFKATLRSLGGKRVATGKDFDPNTGKLVGANVFHVQQSEAELLQKELPANTPWKVSSLEEKPGKQRPAPPFTTSTLQQEANRKLHFSAQRTMQIAQRLYEGVDLGGGERVGVITYMRTDSTSLAQRALDEAQSTIRALYGPDYAQGPRFYKTKSRNAQEAHEAIRPTSINRTPKSLEEFLNRDEFRLYELIWKRTLASQMPDADVLRTSLVIEALDAKKRTAEFAASGKKILFPGYLKAYVEGSDDPAAEIDDQETILPDLKAGQLIPALDQRKGNETALSSVAAEQHFTKPPARFTEAALVKRLEEEGIGRPSTYASIISTIQNRGYVNKQAKTNALIPTFTAMAVTNLMRDHFFDYVDYAFTAKMEEELDDIAEGKRLWVEHIRDFYRGGQLRDAAPDAPTQKGLERRIEAEQENIGLPDVVLGRDEKSGKVVSVRIGRYGPYVVLGEGGDGQTANIPEDTAPADFTVEAALGLIRQKASGPRSLGSHPETGEPIYISKGRFGAYVQLGDSTEANPKPKRASLPTGSTEETITLSEAIQLLVLPRVLGKHPESGEDVVANNGRFGPYVQHQKEFRSLKEGDDVYAVTFDRALELLNQPKAFGRTKKVVREVGKRADGTSISIMEGQYGPYVTDGEINATIPKGTPLETLTVSAAEELLAAKAKAPKKPGAKSAATKTATKTTAAKPTRAKATTAKTTAAKSETKVTVKKTTASSTAKKKSSVWGTKE